MIVLRAIVFFFFISAIAEADIYKYVSEDGVICYTDAPAGKKTQRIIKDNHKEKNRKSETEKAASAANIKDSFHPLIHKKAKEHEIDASLINAVIKAESNGNPHAVSRKGAMGLMQLMPGTASELQVRDPFDPEENIDGGTRYLRYLIERFNGNLTLALAAYNAGPKAVERYGSVPPISETKQYVKKVLAFYNGKADSAYSGMYKPKKAEPIYKIVMEDGTILFTNVPLNKINTLRF